MDQKSNKIRIQFVETSPEERRKLREFTQRARKKVGSAVGTFVPALPASQSEEVAPINPEP